MTEIYKSFLERYASYMKYIEGETAFLNVIIIVFSSLVEDDKDRLLSNLLEKAADYAQESFRKLGTVDKETAAKDGLLIEDTGFNLYLSGEIALNIVGSKEWVLDRGSMHKRLYKW